MKVLVTGAGGFIGRRVRAMLRDLSHGVVDHVHSRDGELDEASLPSGLDAVVNCAGRLGGQGATPAEMRAANVALPARLARLCAARGTPMVHLSTPGVTGLLPEAGEDLPPAPWGEYERTKAEAEEVLQRTLPPKLLTVLRPDFVYGPGDTHKLALFRQVSRGWFPLVGEGDARLRPTYVSDVARSVAESLPGGRLAEGLYNIGGPEVVSVRELVGLIGGALGRRVLTLPIPRPLLRACLRLGPLRPPSLSESRLRLFGEDHYVTVEKASAAGFRPQVAPPEGIAATVDWYRRKRML